MIDKAQKILSEIQTRKLCTMDEHMAFYNDNAKEDYRLLSEIEKLIKALQEKSTSEKKCMFTNDSYTNEERKTLCEDCKEKCEYSKKEEPVSEDFEEASKEWLRPQLDKSYANYGETKMMELTHFDGYAMLDAIEFGANWQKEQFEKNRLAACDRQTEEEAEIEQSFVMGIIECEHRQPTFNDAIKYGMRLKEVQMMEYVIDGLRIRRNKYTKKNVLQGFDVTHDVFQKFKDGDNLKAILIKED